MTAQQTSVSTQSYGIPGTLADGERGYTRSKINEESAAEMPLGVAVKLGTDPETQCKLLAANTDVVHGVTVHSHAYAKDVELGALGVKENVAVGLLRRGTIRVEVSEQIVVDTSAVRIRINGDAGTGRKLGPGSFCKTASAGDTILVTSGMKWVKGAAADGVAELEVDMTSFAFTADN